MELGTNSSSNRLSFGSIHLDSPQERPPFEPEIRPPSVWAMDSINGPTETRTQNRASFKKALTTCGLGVLKITLVAIGIVFIPAAITGLGLLVVSKENSLPHKAGQCLMFFTLLGYAILVDKHPEKQPPSAMQNSILK